MEDIVEGTGRFIVRTIKWLFIEVIIEAVIYWYGRFTLLLFTFGKSPRRGEEAEIRCIITGIISLAATLAVMVVVL